MRLDPERALLGAVLLNGPGAYPALDRVFAAQFTDPRCREIFEAMRALRARAEEIDPLTVRNEMASRGAASRGSAVFVASLIDGLPRTTDAFVFAREIAMRAN